MNVFKTKIRPLGTSACVLIPREELEERELKIGDNVEVTLLVHSKMDALNSLFGMAKKTSSFQRDKKNRKFK